MKAVYYHADSHFPWGGHPGNVYAELAAQFKAQCHEYGMQVVHLTCDGFPGWGDENHSYPLDPKNIVANREEAFCSFLESAPEDWYWFTEPDCVILRAIPSPAGDAVFLYRKNDGVPMNPGWRMATPKALPVFKALRDALRLDPRKDWHGDSGAFNATYKVMGEPKDRVKFLGVDIRFWDFADFVKPGKYTMNQMGPRKLKR